MLRPLAISLECPMSTVHVLGELLEIIGRPRAGVT